MTAVVPGPGALWTASRLDRDCAHRNVLSELTPKKSRDAAAKKGTIFHAALKEWRDTGVVPTLADDEIAAWLAIMVDHRWDWPDGCELEVAWGLSAWGTFVAVEETEPHVYRALDGEDLLTAGRADACWVADGVLVSCDWKTGRTMAAHATENLQINAAGIALAQKWKARAYVPTLYYARAGIWQPGEEIETASAGWGRILDEIKVSAKLDDQPRPGPHCSNCWERKACREAP